MSKVYIFGHRFPDTDSVTSAIALEYLKKEQGVNAEARVLGEINDETRYILNKFNVKVPKYLNDVRLQIRDVLYHNDTYKRKNDSIKEVYDYMLEHNITGVPIVDDNNIFLSIVTERDLLTYILDSNNNELFTSYDNLIECLEAEEIVRIDDEIKGNVNAIAYKSTTFIENFQCNPNDILIVGDRHSVIESAVNNGVRLIIITGNSNIKEEHINIAKENKVNIIRTKDNTFKTTRKILLANYIKILFNSKKSYTILERDYYDDFVERTKELGFNNYPVVDKNGICKGLFRVTDIVHKNKKKVILVDHNESSQSCSGLSEAEILEVIDHHKIGDISTNNPINFRNMTVGSCNTIIYTMYRESRIDIPKVIASIMLGGIISDTLALTSPTTTELDKEAVKFLEIVSGQNYKEYANEMFNVGMNLDAKTENELINLDTKTFNYENGRMIKVSQIVSMDVSNIMERKNKIIDELNTIRENKEYDLAMLLVTDISNNGSYILYSDNSIVSKLILNRAFDKNIEEGTFIPGVVSRKKQIIPLLMEES